MTDKISKPTVSTAASYHVENVSESLPVATETSQEGRHLAEAGTKNPPGTPSGMYPIMPTVSPNGKASRHANRCASVEHTLGREGEPLSILATSRKAQPLHVSSSGAAVLALFLDAA